MNIISWNVNGIRAAIKKDFFNFLKQENPDIFCAQEIKSDKLELDFPNEYYQYWNPAQKKGYSGTLILTKIKPINTTYNIPNHEIEGRVITLEFDKFFLVNCYTPNSQRELARIDYRDLNVAHKEIDLKNPQSNKTTKTKLGNAGFSDRERSKFSEFLESGFIDTFRYFYPDKKDMYTWWSYMFKAREKNSGWRIDYFCVSKNFIKNVKDSLILTDILGSDHCPVKLILH